MSVWNNRQDKLLSYKVSGETPDGKTRPLAVKRIISTEYTNRMEIIVTIPEEFVVKKEVPTTDSELGKYIRKAWEELQDG